MHYIWDHRLGYGRVCINGIIEYGGEVISLSDINELDGRWVFGELNSGGVGKEKRLLKLTEWPSMSWSSWLGVGSCWTGTRGNKCRRRLCQVWWRFIQSFILHCSNLRSNLSQFFLLCFSLILVFFFLHLWWRGGYCVDSCTFFWNLWQFLTPINCILKFKLKNFS